MQSNNKKRQQQYNLLLAACCNNSATVNDVIHCGYRLMRKARLHHHFFRNSLFKIAEYLTFFSLQLPHEYNNENYLTRLVSEQEALAIIKLFEQRIAERLPVEYLTNESWYLGNRFYVNENVLVPRSVMSERFVDFLNQVTWENFRVLDLCTGSGCIGITLALLNPNIKVDLLDISEKSLEVAKINIKNHSLTDRVQCIQSDLFNHVHHTYDLIISNPPYVSQAEYNASSPEFKNEPKIALESGVDGLDIVKQILAQAKNYLNPHGLLIVEVGCTAAKRLKKKYRKIPFKWFNYKRPTTNQSALDQWIDKWFGMDCVFMCAAKEL